MILGKGDMSLPAVVVVDDAATITYTYRSSRIDVRPAPAEILAAAGP